MSASTCTKNLSSPSPPPHAEPMSRTDSGFQETFKRSLAIKSADDGHDAMRHVNARSLQDGLDELPTSPSTSDRPALRKRRSRPSSKHSQTHRRPSLSINRYRSAPDRVFTRQDIDEVLALHTRSCYLFQSFSVPPSAPQSPGLSSIGSRYSIDIPRVNIDAAAPGNLSRTSPQQSVTPELGSYRSAPSLATSTFSRPSGPPSPILLPIDPEDGDYEQEPSTPTIPATTMHWTSPSTRRREYAEIDRSTRGLRGLVRRLTPKCFSTRHLQPFYDEKKAARSHDDTASVRRYRIDLPDEEADDDDDEKRGCEEVSVRPSTAPGRFGKGMLRAWGCGLKGT